MPSSAHGSVKAQPMAHTPGAPRARYGWDNEALARILMQHETISPFIDLVEVFMRNPVRVTRKIVTDAEVLAAHLTHDVPEDQILCILNISQISTAVIQLLGCTYNMDYELWTNRVQGSDREWFAGPLPERGPRDFSHFNLACVDFRRATTNTPKEWMENRKLSHTMRLIRLLDLEDDSKSLPRVYVMRRISGHLRRDGNLWTFLYFNDPYVDLSAAKYILDIPGGVQHPPGSWITTFLNENTAEKLLKELQEDGFGLVLHVLRETEESTDEELIDTAQWLHRRFLLQIDTFQQHLLYHRRYMNYLTKFPTQKGVHIGPKNFKGGLLQEIDALAVVDHRLAALRERTTAILETILNLNTIKQGQLAAEMTRLQREDARISISQGETLKRLTLLNMVCLPPTFVATLFSMNNAQYTDGTAWPLGVFIGIALGFLTLTMLIAVWRWKESPRLIPDGGGDLQLVQLTGHDTKLPLVKRRQGYKFKFRHKSESNQSGDIP